MDIIKGLTVIVVIVAVNLLWIGSIIWLGANIVKGVFGS